MVKAVSFDRDEDDRMGYAVTIDGNWAAVGAYGDDFGASNPNMGSVYIYEQQGVNNWVEVQKLQASDQDDYDRFGWSVSIHGDFLVVGAYGQDDDVSDSNPLSQAGCAYVFKNTGGIWTEMQILNASDRDADDEFGWSVAIYDSTVIVGAHIEDHDALGANFKYHSGSVYSFELGTDNIWTETQKIVADDRWVDMNYPNGYSGEDLADQFGGSCDIWGDYMIVGAHHHDYATTTPLTGALWSSGAAYIFERLGGVWTQVKKIQNFDRAAWDRFGYAVSVDSSVIVVSAYSEDEVEDGVSNPLTNPGSVYIFERDFGGIWNPVQKIVPLDRSSGDHFGYSVDLKDTLMVIGCHSDDHDEFGGDLKTDAGSAYIFEKNGGIWTQFQKIAASDRAESDDFGVSVGISGNTVLVGSQYQDFNAIGTDSLEDAGAAYFYSNQICQVMVTNISPTICSGDSYTIGSSTYTSSGSYTDVLLTGSGCDSTVHTDLTVSPAIVTHLYPTMCDGGVYYIFGVPYTVPGNYSFLTVALNGCDSTIITHLTMDSPITSSQNISICWGESYSIGINTYTGTGIYQDVVSATNFCDSTITTNLTVQLPLDLSISQTISVLTSNENADTYQWFNCETGDLVVGATDQTYLATEVGNYGVILSKNGCVDTSNCAYVSWIVTNLEDLVLDQQVELYPNPSQGEFVIDIQQDLIDSKVRIYTTAGSLIYNQPLSDNVLSIELPNKGVYIVEVTNNGAITRKRLVIQ